MGENKEDLICSAFHPELWMKVFNHSHHTSPVTIYLPSQHKLFQEGKEEETNDRNN